MKRNMTLALLVLTAILCVVATGCGSRKNQTTANDTMNGATSSSGAASGSHAGSSAGQDFQNAGEDVRDTLDSAGNAIGNTVEGVGDAITGNNNTNNGATSNHYASSGVPYDQLLDDGKVTDKDGNLNNDNTARNR